MSYLASEEWRMRFGTRFWFLQSLFNGMIKSMNSNPGLATGWLSDHVHCVLKPF